MEKKHRYLSCLCMSSLVLPAKWCFTEFKSSENTVAEGTQRIEHPQTWMVGLHAWKYIWI